MIGECLNQGVGWGVDVGLIWESGSDQYRRGGWNGRIEKINRIKD